MQHPPDQLCIALGTTTEKKIQSLTEIKNSMAAAIFSFVENNYCSKDFLPFVFCQTIYLEADHLLQQMQSE
jgi:hypothetical protein